MKKILLIGVATVFLVAGSATVLLDISAIRGWAQVQPADEIKMPDVIILGKDAKLGQITFNHLSHNSGKYSIDGTGPIACIECHHTAQPASELAKHPPLKTSWPIDRTTILTADLFAKSTVAAGVAACRDCHARSGQVPKLLAEIPVIKHESSPALITLTNQQAFHRSCTGCHTEVLKMNKAAKSPGPNQCMMCHKKAAA